MYIFDNNFLIDVLANRNGFKDKFYDILIYTIKNKIAYITSGQLDNLRYVIKKAYPQYLEIYKLLESNLQIVKTPSYIDFNDRLAKVDLEDYLIELSAKIINAKIITSDKKFLLLSEYTISPFDFYEYEENRPKKIDFANLKKQHLLYQSEIEKSIDNVLNHGKYIMGPEIQELEENLCKFTGAKNAVTCSSGTDALLLAMMALDIKPGDEIITTPFTFIATAETIALLGAKPVFVDIDETTYNIDPNKIEEKITPKTKAIIPVSLYGQPADLDEINKFTNNKYTNTPIHIIIDGAQSFGATYKDKAEVHYCDIYTTSFFPAKPLGCFGDGGAVLTNSDELAQKIRMLRVHGQNKRYHHKFIGLGGRMDTVQCAITDVKLKYYDKDLAKRQEVAKKYSKKLKIKNEKLILPFVDKKASSAWAQYSIRVKNRDEVQAKLKEKEIPTAIHYPMPLHMQECFKYLGYKEGDFPVAERVSKEIMSLPMNPYLTDVEIDYVAKEIVNATKITNLQR